MGNHGERSSRSGSDTPAAGTVVQRAPGKRSLSDARYGVQRRQAPTTAPAAEEQVQRAAAAGTAGHGGDLPHLDRIQAAFGPHDVSGVQAHVGGAATEASDAMGAEAFATGNHVAFRASPDLHTAAHEAAHVVQQRTGVSLKGGVGESGDRYEQHADAVADAVVAGRSAAGLLDEMAGTGGGGAAVQRKNLTQHGLDGGLKASGTGTIVNRAKAGKIYDETVTTKVADRTAALTKASERNADVGNRTTGKDWTKDSATFDDDGAASLDPFLYKVMVPFGKDESDELLELTYQHADRWTGYVVGIEDTTNGATDKGATMYNGFDVRDGKATKGSTDKFTNVHDTSDTAGKNLAAETSGDKEHNLDAYTKIAGEGARWQCVRAHASSIQNDTLFFVAHASDTKKVVGVTFQTLWGNWAKAFSKRYDIPDSDVAASLKTGVLAGVAKEVDVASLTGKDYDVTNSKAHGS